MVNQTSPSKQDKLGIPAEAYNDPAELVADNKLSREEKMKALKNWEDEEKSLMTADDENMAILKKNTAPTPADMLKKIHKAERRIERQTPFYDFRSWLARKMGRLLPRS